MPKEKITLPAFGFTKLIAHRIQKIIIDIPNAGREKTLKRKCHHCMQGLKN